MGHGEEFIVVPVPQLHVHVSAHSWCPPLVREAEPLPGSASNKDNAKATLTFYGSPSHHSLHPTADTNARPARRQRHRALRRDVLEPRQLLGLARRRRRADVQRQPGGLPPAEPALLRVQPAVRRAHAHRREPRRDVHGPRLRGGLRLGRDRAALVRGVGRAVELGRGLGDLERDGGHGLAEHAGDLHAAACFVSVLPPLACRRWL